MRTTPVLFLAIAALTRTVRGDGSLEAPRIVEAPSPASAAVGDFDGDRRLDIATVSLDGSISICLARLPRRDDWEILPAFQHGQRVLHLRSADFDADGDDDLAAADLNGTSFVLLSQGDGAFGPPRLLSQARQTRWLALADLDGDGLLDLAAASPHTNEVAVSLGGAGGGFRFLQSHRPIRGNPHCVEALDWNGDGRRDLAAGLPDTGTWPLLGAGAPGGLEPCALTLELGLHGAALRYLSAGDLDGDGRDDLASAAGLAGLSRGDGTFAPLLDAALPGGVISPLIADFDGDGARDVTFTDPQGVHVYARRGGEAFGAPATVPHVGRFPYTAAGADLNQDGKSELLIADIDAPHLTVYRGAASPRLFETAAAIGGVRSAGALALGAVDGDGMSDLVIWDASVGLVLGILMPPARGAPPVILHEIPPLVAALAAADWDGNGLIDLAASVPSRSEIWLALQDAAAEPGWIAIAAPAGVDDLAAGDLDQDGALDLLGSGEEGLQLWRGRGDGTLAGPTPLEEAAPPRRAGVVIDATGDGSPDIAAIDPATGEVAIITVTHRDGGWSSLGSTPAGPEPSDLAAADLDPDGLADLVVASSSQRRISILHGTGASRLAGPTPYAAADGPDEVGAADLDGDGTIDVTYRAGGRLGIVRGHGGSASSPSFRRGDADRGGTLQLTDAVVILRHLFLGGAPLDCEDAADADDDGRLAITDAVIVLDHLFLGGRAPPAPGPIACGQDPTADGLAACRPECASR
jgi:hypothetical protein